VKAAILKEAVSPPEPGEAVSPSPGEGETVVDVLAAGLNPVDVQLAERVPADELPLVPGREGVGRTPAGERVYFERATTPHGSFAEQAVVATGELIPVPERVDDATAVALGIAGLAGWVSVEWRAALRPGETVLVLGASGVVGQVALQAARLLGAGRVVAAARSAEGRERAEGLGADATVDLSLKGDLSAAMSDALAGGADVVVDPIWGRSAAAALRTVRPGARLVQIGEAAGSEAPVVAGPLRMSQAQILGYANGATPAEVKRNAYLRILEHAARGELGIQIERTSLYDISETWERQKAAGGLKFVIVP